MAKLIETDVLVIGGGGGGAKAALELRARGVPCVLAVKGVLGKSGCSIFAGNLDYFAAPEGEAADAAEDSDQERAERVRRNMEFLAKFTHYLGDQRYFEAVSEWHHREFFPWLEGLGLYLLRDESGAVVSDKPLRTQAWAPEMGMSGQIIMDMLRKQIHREGIEVLEQTAITRLLVDGEGRCCGAIGFEIGSGTTLVIRSRAVVLATGHNNYLSRRSTGTREGVANGWVMAYEAGARLKDIEIQWYHGADISYPETWMRLHMYPNPLPGSTQRNRLHNNRGEAFFDSTWLKKNPVPYVMQLKYLTKEVEAGRARFDGDYYSSYRHVEPGVLDHVHQRHFLAKLGLDGTRDLIESGITYHMNVGGMHVDGLTMASDVPGLFGAGSVNGALITGGIPNVIYEGMVAATSAAAYAEGLGARPEPDAAIVAAEEERIEAAARLAPPDGLLPAQVKRRIRTVMWEHFNYVKSETSMNRALEELGRIGAEDVPRMGLHSRPSSFNYDWVDALDVADMLAFCEWQVRFSLYREESRGGFYREDFPVTDNRNWLVHVVGQKGPDGLELGKEPVDLPYTRPEEEVVDFFEADY